MKPFKENELLNCEMTRVRIKENSIIARIAAYKLGSKSVAMVIGKTIYLHNCSKEDFLNDQRWVNHELTHVKQYNELGLFRFLGLYLLETLKRGYEKNRFEVEARQEEKNTSLLSSYNLHS